MKTIFVFLVILHTACTCSAAIRGILVEVTTHKDNPPTVSIYSDFKSEQMLDASIAEAVVVLGQVEMLRETLEVSVLFQGWIKDKFVWQLLDGLKKNPMTSLIYLEVNFSSEHDRGMMSVRGRELQDKFKVPKYTKNQSL